LLFSTGYKAAGRSICGQCIQGTNGAPLMVESFSLYVFLFFLFYAGWQYRAPARNFALSLLAIGHYAAITM
jgi:hypothetical protein